MYYVRRDGRIKGPLSREKLRSLREQKRLRMRDEIATAIDGPWRSLRDMREEVLGGNELPLEERFPKGDELPPFDSGVWRDAGEEEPPAPVGVAVSRDRDAESEWLESLRTWIEGEDRLLKPFRPQMYVLGALLLVVLGTLALSVVFGTH